MDLAELEVRGDGVLREHGPGRKRERKNEERGLHGYLPR
jgi:hypothetical protein